MKANKALKRLTHADDLISDVMERYSESAPDIRQQLLDAKASVGRAKEAVKLHASSRTTSASKKTVTKKAVVKVPPAKAKKKHGTTKRNYDE
jgi:hypothetical protein